jgi:hypothetical protein
MLATVSKVEDIINSLENLKAQPRAPEEARNPPAGPGSPLNGTFACPPV